MSGANKQYGVSPLPAGGLIRGDNLRTIPTKRKLEVDDKMLEDLEWWGRMGYDNERICSRLGISKSRFTGLMKEDCRIKIAIERGQNDVHDMLVKSAYRDAQKDGKLALQILKAKFGWNPTSTQHLIIDQEPEIKELPKSLGDDPIEASRIYQKLME